MIAQPQILDNFKFLTALNLSHTITAGTIATPANLAKGEIVVTDLGNVVLNSTTILSTDKFKIVQGRGAGIPLVESKPLDAAAFKSYSIVPYAAKVQQVVYIGYNAATGVGAFDVINNNTYSITTSFWSMWGQDVSSLNVPMFSWIESDATATQEEIVNALYALMVDQLARFPKKPITLERVNSENTTVVAGTGNITYTEGSPLITATATAGLVVGDYIRLGLGVTDAVYKITAVTGTSFTVDTPVQTSGSLLAAAWEGIAAATAAAANFGIRQTGINLPFILDSRPADLVQFQTGIYGGGSTPVTYQVGAFQGHGTYELLRQDEAASWRNQGQIFNYTEFPPTQIETDLNTTGVYSTLNIGWHGNRVGITNGHWKGDIMIALEITTLGTPNVYSNNITGSAISVVDVIDAFATSIGFPTQIPNL